MNALVALALACTLSTSPSADPKTPTRETSTYVVTDQMAIWLTEAGKLKLSMAHQPTRATIELRNGTHRLYRSTVDLRNGVFQSFDLSDMPQGTYQIYVTIGQDVTVKTVRISQVQERQIQLS